jgi:ATP-binding cassette subfamily B multidrug efflux pump
MKMSETKSKGKTFDVPLFKRVVKYVGPYKRTFYLTLFLTVALAFISPLRPWLIQYTIDNYVITPDANWLSIMTFILVLTLIVEAALQFYQTYMANWLGHSVIKDIRKEIFHKILHFRLKYFDNTPIGILVTRCVNDTETIADVFSQGLLVIIGDLLKLTVVIIFMFATDWKLTLFSLAPIPLLLLSTYFFKKAIKSAFQDVRTQVAKLNSFVQEHVTGMNIVQIFNREKVEMQRFQELNRNHRGAHIRTVWAYSVFFPIVEILSALSLAFLVWWGASGVLTGDVSYGDLVAFILYIYMLYRPIRQLADRFNTLQMGMVSSERVFKIIDTDSTIENNGTHTPTEVKGKIELKEVWFAYIDQDWVLKNVSIHVEPGETVAIVGATGSGKTTLINLLGRYYEFNKGAIFVDEVDIRDYQLAALRSSMALVLQDVFLFSDTILNNITLFDPNISREAVETAAKNIGAHEFIATLPGGYDYNVRERGGVLSVGQRQLISFIRAYVQRPAILILDEATSSIDTKSEELIQRATEVLTKDRTSIVIAHRLSTIQNADKIIVLHKGEVVEQGRHDELIENGGQYKQLFELQFRNEVVAE